MEKRKKMIPHHKKRFSGNMVKNQKNKQKPFLVFAYFKVTFVRLTFSYHFIALAKSILPYKTL